MNQTPKKQPVQPWIPQQRPAVRSQVPAGLPQDGVVHVVHHHDHKAVARQVDKLVRAGWLFALVCAILIGVGMGLLSWRFLNSESGGRLDGFGLVDLTGAIFTGLGYYLALFVDLVVVVIAIVVMVKGAVGRGIFLLLGAPVMMLALVLLCIFVANVARNKIVIEDKPARPAKEEAAVKPAVPVDPVKSAQRMDEILENARKILEVRHEGTYAAAKNDAFAQAAYDPALTEAHREALRAALEEIYAEADLKRTLKSLR